MVHEPVGDAGLVGDVRHAAGVEALAGEHPHRRRQDLAALLFGVLRARAAAPAASAGCSNRLLLGPAVGLARGGWPARAGSSGSPARARGRPRPARSPRRPGPAPARSPTGRRSSNARRSAARRGGARTGWRRSRTAGSRSPWPAAAPPSGRGWWRSVKAAGTVISCGPLHGEDPVQLGEAQVVADRQPQARACGGVGQHDLLAGELELGLAVDACPPPPRRTCGACGRRPCTSPSASMCSEVLASFSSPSSSSSSEPGTSSTPSSRASPRAHATVGPSSGSADSRSCSSEPIEGHFSGSTISSAPARGGLAHEALGASAGSRRGRRLS